MNTDSDVNKSKKIVCLMMLLSGTRINTLTHLEVTNMYITDTECTFVFDEILKHSRSIYCQKHLIFRAYLKYPELYPVKKLIKLSRYKINKNVKSSTFFFYHKTI